VTSENPTNPPNSTHPTGNENATNKADDPQGTHLPAVRSEVQIPPSQPCYKITCEKKRDGWDQAKLVAEFVGIVFLIVYTIYTAGIYCANKKAAEAAKSAADTAHDAFIATNRAFVGIDGPRADKNLEKHTMNITVPIKNFGNIPAYEFLDKWDVLIDGVKQTMEKRIPDGPSILLPGQPTYLTAFLARPTYDALEARTQTLEICIVITYAGPVEKYETRQKIRYAPQFAVTGNPRIGMFYNLGSC